jgi:hypothetical protein
MHLLTPQSPETHFGFPDFDVGTNAKIRNQDMAFAWAPIERICEASGIDIRLFRDESEDNVGGLLAHWYAQHRAAGGLPDLVMDDLIGESEIEDTHGHGFSHQPGQA